MGATAFVAYGEGVNADHAFANARASARRDDDRRGFASLLARTAGYTVVDEAPTSIDDAVLRAADHLRAEGAMGRTGPEDVRALAIRGGTRTVTVTIPPREGGWDSVADALNTVLRLDDGESVHGTPVGTYDTDDTGQRCIGGTATVTITGGTSHTGWLFFGWSGTDHT